MNALYRMLDEAAKTERRTQYDSELISPDTRGVVVIKAFKDISTDLVKRAIVELRIVESHPTKPGAVAQPAGTDVKKFYNLSKGKFVLTELMNDILNITGANPKDVNTAELFEQVFEKNVLCGVMANFKSVSKEMNKKTGQKRDKPWIDVYFSECKGPVDENGSPDKGHVNHEDEIKKRAASL